MKLLAVDTSTRHHEVAVLSEDGRVDARAATTPDENRPLQDLVRECVDGRWEEIGAYALGVGPGSFTGLRVGLAFVKGLAAARPKPVVPVSSLAAWAQTLDAHLPAGDRRPRWVVLDARREQVWLGTYDVAEDGVVAPRAPDRRTPLQALRTELSAEPTGVLVTTLDDDTIRSAAFGAEWELASGVPGPSAVHLGRLAQRAFAQGAGVPARNVAPNYLMLVAAEEKLQNVANERPGR